MTPEITDPRFKAIAEEIRNDPENASFTKRGIDPLFFAGPDCRIMIVGQAPGRVAEESGIVWNDRSGDRLREWMGIDRDTFYNSGKLAIVPMDFYFPGTGKSGDLPPRKDFADKWHPRLLELMPDLKLTILVGSYAICSSSPRPRSRRSSRTTATTCPSSSRSCTPRLVTKSG